MLLKVGIDLNHIREMIDTGLQWIPVFSKYKCWIQD